MLKVPAIINKITTLADGSLKLVVECQELTPENEVEVVRLRNKTGWFVFSDTGINEQDIPQEAPDFNESQTLDERLNKVLYAYHMRKTNDSKSFHEFRRKTYETWIEKFKALLNE